MITFFDTETTGLIAKHLKNAPWTHPEQSRLVQLGCITTDYDGTERHRVSLVVRPIDEAGNPYEIPEGAAAVHGITTEVAMRIGLPLKVVAAVFTNLLRVSTHACAHNEEFDRTIMNAALHRAGAPPEIFAGVTAMCTKNASTMVVNLPPTKRMIETGFGGKPKPPTVAEAVRFFFGREPTKAHDALGDVQDCHDVYFELVRQGRMPCLGTPEDLVRIRNRALGLDHASLEKALGVPDAA